MNLKRARIGIPVTAGHLPAGHTPGPWHVGKHLCRILSEQNHLVARTCHSEDEGSERQEEIANAALIASAPATAAELSRLREANAALAKERDILARENAALWDALRTEIAEGNTLLEANTALHKVASLAVQACELWEDQRPSAEVIAQLAREARAALAQARGQEGGS